MTGPVVGVVIGGYILDKVGGYTSPKAYPICVFVMCIGSCFGVPTPFVDTFFLNACCLWG